MNKALAPLLISTVMFALPLHAEDKPDAGKDYVMLKADGEEIKKSEVEEAWKAIFQGREAPAFDSMAEPIKEKFLREVASEHELYKQAEKAGVENTPEVQALVEKVKHQIVIQEFLKGKTKDAISDDKLKAAYDAHVKEAGSGEEYHARHILVKTKEEAEAIEKKLKKGGDFDKLAKEKSNDKASGAAGGDLGWFAPDKMVPEFSAALMKLKKGEISSPVKTDFGWHIIKLEDSRKATPPAFADVKEALKQEVGNKAVSDYVKDIMKDAKITVVDASGHESPLPAESAPPKDMAPAAGGKGEKDAPAEQ